ncbi:energy-coupling factor transport system permease protein [Weissella beninensis]|uniref:Energy-coupling factor transporter transmembrane protein EcfT n=2 Tax=Periweissella beninensis TaxID=504936 RepID=A0ABT0VJE7_9LACO|nr:energy-coupling factor transporter transmembrane component T [Periweissella beninensis]MBM7544684.1 energy-coupling factor transport system permease protein [Periweissella beninensis]MCM2437958.1 energy-coupling factor transporter transmembrane protein EcfT [Periweissella beninensis]
MNNTFVIDYVPGKTKLQQLQGISKLALLGVMLIFIMISFDIRVLVPMFIFNTGLVIATKPSWQKIKGLLYFILITNTINVLLMYLVSPDIGPQSIGSKHVIFEIIGRYNLSVETLFYLGVRFLKIMCMFVASLWFILSITPSQLAQGLYKLHVPYRICTVVALGLRAIPDILRDYQAINQALQMRGLELDKRRASVFKRLKHAMMIVIPLILTTFEQVDTIASAMDLRLYGSTKKRSYYIEKPLTKVDYLALAVAGLLLLVLIAYCLGVVLHTQVGASRIWYPR